VSCALAPSIAPGAQAPALGLQFRVTSTGGTIVNVATVVTPDCNCDEDDATTTVPTSGWLPATGGQTVVLLACAAMLVAGGFTLRSVRRRTG
jgi:hypothetical protein